MCHPHKIRRLYRKHPDVLSNKRLTRTTIATTNLRAAFRADHPLTKPAVVPFRAKEREARLHTEEAEFSARHVLLDVTLDRERVQLRLREDGADVDHLVKSE